MPKRFWLPAALAVAAVSIGCGEQPYPVFAVQIAQATQPAALTGTATSGAAGAAPLSAGAPSPAQPAAREIKRETRKVRPGPSKHALPWALNRAPAADLAQLPGMDTATLQRIVQGRPYANKRDLLRRHVLTPAQYAHWKNALVVHRSWQAEKAKQARSEVSTRP